MKDMNSTFSEQATDCISLAIRLAAGRKRSQVTADDLLSACVLDRNNQAAELLQGLDVLDKLAKQLDVPASADALPASGAADMDFDDELRRVFDLATATMAAGGRTLIDSSDLLGAMLALDNSHVQTVLREAGVTERQLAAQNQSRRLRR
jgi:ATP-dependent Clp protease ATP-binding subunit ClpA